MSDVRDLKDREERTTLIQRVLKVVKEVFVGPDKEDSKQYRKGTNQEISK